VTRGAGFRAAILVGTSCATFALAPVVPASASSDDDSYRVSLRIAKDFAVPDASVQMGNASYLVVTEPGTSDGELFVAAPDGGPDPVALPLGAVDEALRLRGGHRYTLLIASDGDAAVVWPRGTVLRERVYPAPSFHLSVSPLSPPAGALAVGSVPDNLGGHRLAVTAVVGFWPVAPTLDVRTGDACPTANSIDTCTNDSPATQFVRQTDWLSADGTASERYISGRTYLAPQPKKYVSGYMTAASTSPFTSALLITFGVGRP
jgi:hypothetical protein